MGRPVAKIDEQALMDLLERDLPQKEAARELGISIPTLAKRMADIREKQGILLKYRDLQSLHLTELQARVLEAITPEKINEASLRDLVLSYKILKDKELNIDGKPSEIKGLVAYLVEIEKREMALDGSIDVEDIEDIKDYEDDKTSPDILQ